MGTRMPQVYISKYNRFVDNIISRINRILGKSYDPVRVKLHSIDSKKKSSSKKRKSNKRKQSSKNALASNKMLEQTIARMTESEAREPEFVLISSTSTDSKPDVRNVTEVAIETRVNAPNGKKNRRKSNKGKTKASSKRTAKPRATLFGLSSIKREGDVSVNMMADHTTVKTNFVLGPLTLRVEKEVRILF